MNPMVVEKTLGPTARPQPNEYSDHLTPCPDWLVRDLKEQYGFTDQEIHMKHRLKWAPRYRRGRLAMPIVSRFGTRNGWVFRAVDIAGEARDVPKTINMLTIPDAICVSWYPCHSWNKESMYGLNDPIVLVEDCLSAMKASRHVHALALLGTHVSEAKLMEVVKARPSRVILALDADATAKAAKIVTDFGGLINNFTMVELKRDLKDSEDAAIPQILGLK